MWWEQHRNASWICKQSENWHKNPTNGWRPGAFLQPSVIQAAGEMMERRSCGKLPGFTWNTPGSLTISLQNKTKVSDRYNENKLFICYESVFKFFLTKTLSYFCYIFIIKQHTRVHIPIRYFSSDFIFTTRPEVSVNRRLTSRAPASNYQLTTGLLCCGDSLPGVAIPSFNTLFLWDRLKINVVSDSVVSPGASFSSPRSKWAEQRFPLRASRLALCAAAVGTEGDN